ncbi:MAG: hypothetical protein KJO22_05725 [Bacteroidia bacterium]|nr:hypothetical protein [Bacteroidia bacterium]
MIKFFRHIRQSLINQNKTKKYLLYAIGEIILVVIGILIALQIDNWNTARINKVTEIKTLNSLYSDLALQTKIIQKQIDKEESFIHMVDSGLRMINTKNQIDSFVSLMDSLTVRLTFVANRVTFDNIGKGAKTTVITNSDLHSDIVKYYQYLDYTESVVNNNNLFRVNSQFGDYILDNELGIQMNEQGELYLESNLGPEKKYKLTKQLEGRKYSAENNRDKCLSQLEKTKTLMQSIETELADD